MHHKYTDTIKTVPRWFWFYAVGSQHTFQERKTVYHCKVHMYAHVRPFHVSYPENSTVSFTTGNYVHLGMHDYIKTYKRNVKFLCEQTTNKNTVNS